MACAEYSQYERAVISASEGSWHADITDGHIDTQTHRQAGSKRVSTVKKIRVCSWCMALTLIKGAVSLPSFVRGHSKSCLSEISFIGFWPGAAHTWVLGVGLELEPSTPGCRWM